MFLVRDPVERFISGFNSRLRQGKPRYDTPWDDAERVAFAAFTSPDQLVHALALDDADERASAERAMRSIRHVKTSYWDWFENEAYLRSRLDDLLLIGRTERLADDFERLREALTLPDDVQLPDDAVGSHRSPRTGEPSLEPDAVETLRRWYARDYDFIELCDEIERERTG